jgi:hypothetical protein
MVRSDGKGLQLGSTVGSGDLLLRPDLASNSGAGLINYLADGTGAHGRTLDARIRDRLEVSVMDFIPEVQHAAIVAGTSTYNAGPDIQKAIDAIATLGGGTVFFPKGTYRTLQTLLVSKSGTWLRGVGGGHFMSGHDNIRASALSRIEWDPGNNPASGTAIVRFATPINGNYSHSGGMSDLMLDGQTVCPIGLHLISWNHATYDRVTVFACTQDHYLLETADYALTQTVGASQHNRFNECFASTVSGSGWYLTSQARGWRFKGGSATNSGDSSINSLMNCKAYMSMGVGIVLENCGQNMFVSTWGGTAYSMTTPVNTTHVVVNSGGSLGAGTYYYRVAAYNDTTGEWTDASTHTSVVVSSGVTNRIQVNWLPVAGATHYRVYGRTNGAEKFLAQVTSNFTSMYDDGSITPTVLPPAARRHSVILGSSDQATNSGPSGVARYHCFLFCEMTFYARASQQSGGVASFGNMIFGASNGDSVTQPIWFEEPANNTSRPTVTMYASGSSQNNLSAQMRGGQLWLDQVFGASTTPGPLAVLDRRLPGVTGQYLGEVQWMGGNAAQAGGVLMGRIRSQIDFNTVGAESATLYIGSTFGGDSTGNAAAFRNGMTVPDGVSSVTMKGYGTINLSNAVYIRDSQVIGPRDTGWTAATGTANKGAFATYAGQTHGASYSQSALQALDNATKANSQRLKAIEDALRATHGLIGA